jgi:hypothetical protein
MEKHWGTRFLARWDIPDVLTAAAALARAEGAR